MAKIRYAYSGWSNHAGGERSRARTFIARAALAATVGAIAVFDVVDQVITPASVVNGPADCRLNWPGSECGHELAQVPDDAVAARWPVQVIAIVKQTLPEISTRPPEVAIIDRGGGDAQGSKEIPPRVEAPAPQPVITDAELTFKHGFALRRAKTRAATAAQPSGTGPQIDRQKVAARPRAKSANSKYNARKPVRTVMQVYDLPGGQRVTVYRQSDGSSPGFGDAGRQNWSMQRRLYPMTNGGRGLF